MSTGIAALLYYFQKEMKEGKSEFRLVTRPAENADGVAFYMHPHGEDGDTCDMGLVRLENKEVKMFPVEGP